MSNINISRGENLNNTTLELQQDLARCTPRQCVTLTHSVPSVQMYYALRTKLESCNEKWLQEFLDLGGVDSLLDSLDQMAGRGFTCFSDAILQIDCISCIRCILNTGIGLEYFVSNDVYTKKLTMALNSGDTLPKKQVFEVLSAVCVHSNIGYLRVLEGLSYVKSECDQMHRFSLIVNDLQASETIAHKTSVLTFINAVINSTPDITERIRIRNEFVGLKLLDILTYIRKEEPDENLLLQLEVFHERKISDEDLLNTNNNLDFNSPQDLLDQLQSRVFGSPRMVNFVNILQDLLAIETVHNEHSVKLWQTVDNLIHHVVHTMSSPSLTNIQSVLHKLPEELQQGLQCIQSYQDRKASASLTSLHSTASQNSKYGSKTSLNSKRDSKSSLKSKRDSQCSVGSKRSSRGSVSSLNKPNIPKSVTFLDETSNQSGCANYSNSSNQSASANYSNSSNQSASANYSANSDSFSSSDQSGPQNKTVVLNKLGESSQSQNSSGVNDRTVVLCQNLSDTKNNSVTSSVSSHPSSEGSVDSYSLNKTDSFKAKNRKIGDQSHEENQSELTRSDIPAEQTGRDGRNMNIQEEKPLNYNQSKVGSQLRVPRKEGESSRRENCGSVYDNLPELDMEPPPTKTTGLTKMQSLSKLKRTICKMSSPKSEAPHVVVKPCNMVARQLVPAPSKQMVDLKWVVLTDDRIVGHEPCVWLPTPSDKEKLSVDYKKLEVAFQTAKTDMVEEVALLNGNTRLNINLFLSRLDSGAEDLVQNLEDGNISQLSLPMLQYLIKLMPCPEEVEMLRSYTGPRLELGMAEQFVLLLSDIPDYSVLLEGQLIRAEFDSTISQFKDSLNAMIATANLVLNHPDLKRLLHVILGIGNFLNYGMFNGDAAGFKISTLMRLQEVKSRSPCKSLLHHLVQMVNDSDQKLLGFVNEILPLEKAASCSVEELKGSISKLNGKLRNFVNNLTKSGQQLQNMFASFIETLKIEFATIQCATTELRSLTDQLAEYFCEEESQFNIQEFFQCLLSFCKEVKKCQSDNMAWARQQQVAKKKGDALHKRLKNKLFSLEFGENAAASSSMVENKPKVLEKMLDQLHRGNFNPSIPSVLVAPDNEGGSHFEMSCIPCQDSPLYRPRLGTNLSDSVFIDTPEITRTESVSAAPKLTRSSTQKINPVSTCTAQTKQPNSRPYNERLVGELPESYLPSPITATPVDSGKMTAPQKNLFGIDKNNMDSKRENDLNMGYEKPKMRQQLEMPRRHRGHCRSRSDLADSICAVNKWIEYEKLRNSDQSGKAPLAEPESACNISTLNLENQGKFITKEDVADYRHPSGIYQDDDVCNLQEGPIVKMPDGKQKKPEKKSSVGGFFSKLGRAVLKPRNVYSDGDQYGPGVKPKKLFNTDKENLSLGAMTEEEKGLRDSKRFKPEGNKVSRFFQRGGIYRSSKMKAKNLHQNVK